MINLIISGCNGRMGRVIADIAAEDSELHVVAGIDRIPGTEITFPVYASLQDFTGVGDVIIDFSSPDALDGILAYCVGTKTPAVLCTTGYTEEHIQRIQEVSRFVPIFKSANMSIGVNLLAEIVREAAAKLGADFDVEIVESHHRKKLDAPSGTALMLADAVKQGRSDTELQNIYERQSRREPRASNELGISAVRAGTIPGEHTVIFAGRDEVLEFKHTVYSREVFASGAVKAAKFLAAVKEPGLYSKL
ncbi:MAG: 4-hydroxy-tetrahydrodipicolinate reductase [Oscillospiraceae bacterium]|jgi:4-hydroxy-tetrahydrodipicolinate reductase|nr:4-hydroxy-tetrahydrodipicolinate reductase [Oscillospiraceae bacterium]